MMNDYDHNYDNEYGHLSNEQRIGLSLRQYADIVDSYFTIEKHIRNTTDLVVLAKLAAQYNINLHEKDYLLPLHELHDTMLISYRCDVLNVTYAIMAKIETNGGDNG